MFRKILIANRGEIAVRVIRACRDMGIRPVAVYSEADRAARHVRFADEAYRIGGAAAADSYLRIDRVLAAAKRCGAEAIHPGYGFLSENADFAAACQQAGLRFIGPPADAIRSMGVKTQARKIMAAAGVPVVPGTPAAAGDLAQAAQYAERVGYPVMLKAAAGGGGMGMRQVEDDSGLASAWEQARGEALKAFGDDSIYIEKAIVRPRHVEVQILADHHGRVVHLGERECSLQRRRQKVLEETPSPWIEEHPRVRERLCAAAVAAAKAAGYANAGTVEFLLDQRGRFYFLEMNTRLQVEHPVTELVTGTDLVKEQILVAAGRKLQLRQEDIRFRGHAMQCRVYAEDPRAGFLPSPGRIDRLTLPEGPGIRVDCGAEEGWSVPLEYDPLIAKLCAWGQTRTEVIARLQRALSEFRVGGIATTLDLFRQILADRRFQRAEFDTGFLEREFAMRPPDPSGPPAEVRLAAMLAVIRASQAERQTASGPPDRKRSLWNARGRLAAAGFMKSQL